MKKILLNISGHPLSNITINELKNEYSVIEDIPFGNIVFTDNIEEQIKNILAFTNERIDGSIPIAIIPPGQSTLAILIFTYLYGVLGYPPDICYLEASPENIYTPKSIFKFDTKKLKINGRDFRQEIWKKYLP